MGSFLIVKIAIVTGKFLPAMLEYNDDFACSFFNDKDYQLKNIILM